MDNTLFNISELIATNDEKIKSFINSIAAWSIIGIIVLFVVIVIVVLALKVIPKFLKIGISLAFFLGIIALVVYLLISYI
ncbi:unknown; predicted coding region [Mycoplasmopsis pulmonis]|uniref:Uncharacterized protein n=1 Tax=Mycoplasmopsis pulmonis (strain UAB CTIP) TaxID=272635 RepID=Q98Q58_MYCPU|nr:hypothetical protein [Mycoplasmopsis pulmonis]MDZ7293480.1 hypothetical protein [Mycoplasmopsis pulmonis]CAC13683.1 unknown; predicted coding region [Mycoplasmopsis pulmonis]VEU68278.1 Uncharacterised protein [Mycoplasmopsis pulmonis]